MILSLKTKHKCQNYNFSMVNSFNFPRVTQSVASTRAKGIKLWHSGKSLRVRARELVYSS